MKKTFNLSRLMESELDKAQVILAIKSISDKLQNLAEDIMQIEVKDIMPMVDSVRDIFGHEASERFYNETSQTIRTTVESIRGAKDKMGDAIDRLENGGNDMANDDMGAIDLGMGDEAGDDMADAADLPADDAGMDAAPDLGGDAPADDMDLSSELGDDFGDDNSAMAAGRAKKESFIAANINMLREAADPDKLLSSVFKLKLKEMKDTRKAANFVAKSFGVDVPTVAEAVKNVFEAEKKPKKARPYHTLLCRDDGEWTAQFGDYDKKVVQQEMKDTYKRDYKQADLKIVTTETSKNAEINKIIAELNGK